MTENSRTALVTGANKGIGYEIAAGLVEVQPSAQQRIYRLRAEPFVALDAWLASYRAVKEASYDRLAERLEALQAEEKRDDSGKIGVQRHTAVGPGDRDDADV